MPSRRIPPRLLLRFWIAALLVSALTAVISRMPKFELLEAEMNDDNFTDLVQQTRGEAPIDSSIRILTYDRAIFDAENRVDRSLLAMRLAALFEMEPRVVGVDFLVEDLRPESPEGDQMLAGLVRDHPNLIFGLFYEDSLGRFRMPPKELAIPSAQLGVINIQPDDDRTIRTFSPHWGNDSAGRVESFDLRLARFVAPTKVDALLERKEESYVIDYAAGIGERGIDHTGEPRPIFPVLPIDTLFAAVMSGDSARTAMLSEWLRDKVVLVGYGELGTGQVTSIVDRFYTPLRPDKNDLPDMHGVAVHANILNSILQGRLQVVMPLWVNILWGSLVVLPLLLWRHRLAGVSSTTRRSVLFYAGFATLFVLGALLPILAYRYTSFKFSIYTPLAGLLLAVPTLEVLGLAGRTLRDLRRRRWIARHAPPQLRPVLREMLRPNDPHERLLAATHFVRRELSTAVALLLSARGRGIEIPLSERTITSPSVPRLVADLEALPRELVTSEPLAGGAARVGQLAIDGTLRSSLRLGRSLLIALNEIRRQTAVGDEEEEMTEGMGDTEGIGVDELALEVLGRGDDHDEARRFDLQFDAIRRYIGALGALGIWSGNAHDEPEAVPPYAITARCRLHDREERFLYALMQEDANEQDDLFDLVYVGTTIRCTPVDHPSLAEFKAIALGTSAAADEKETTNARRPRGAEQSADS